MRLETLRLIRRTREGLKLLWESDEKRVRRKYVGELGREPNLDSPATYTEKVLWLNLHHRDPRLVTCADKYAVRQWVADRVGEDLLVPLLGVYDDADDIDPAALPDAFVIKATHGSGWNLIVPDKRALDWGDAKRSLQNWLSRNYYAHKREWQYRDIPPRLIVEEFLDPGGGAIPSQFQFFCFRRGEDRTILVQVDFDEQADHRRDYYDEAWNRMPFASRVPNAEREAPRPERLEEMLSIARRLSEDFPFVRVDLYEVRDRIYFGEMTFTSGGGMSSFDPPEWDRKLGDLMGLPVG
ncbi:MAG: glycosyl transferase [marine benthic group bacterium]|nr:glycosyl transferase [Candidatus Benthicola marisminoris]